MNILRTKGAKSRERALDLLKTSIGKGKVRNNDDATKLIFLCGGSDKFGSVSERRKQVERFLKSRFKGKVEVFYAEDFVKSFAKIQRKAGLLDLESSLFQLSDRVIVILEGYGAACELGAFANPKRQREKLIVINNKKYEKDESFITLGPIRSIQLANPSEKRIIYYTFSESGKESIDGISDTFLDLDDLISSVTKAGHSGIRVTLGLGMDFSSKGDLTQSHIFLIHDLIFLCGPAKGTDVIEILKYLFGGEHFDKFHAALALLKACGMIKEEAGKTYSSLRLHLFLEYGKMSRNQVIAAFRMYSILNK